MRKLLVGLIVVLVALAGVGVVAGQDVTETPVAVATEVAVPDVAPIVVEGAGGISEGVVLAILAAAVVVIALFGVFIRGVVKAVLGVLPNALDAMLAAAYGSAETQLTEYVESTPHKLDDALADYIKQAVRQAFAEAGVPVPGGGEASKG
jgi:hypothetical protein